MKSLLGIIFAAALIAPAGAADLAITKSKAVPFLSSTPCTLPTATTPLSCSGFYLGGGISGQGSNANVIGNGINGSVFAGGMVPTLDFGYQYAQGNWIFAAEFDLGYAMGSAVTVNGAGSNLNGLHTTELVKVGGNLAALFGTQAPITIPPQLAASVIAPYATIGQTQWQLAGKWANGTVSGAGVLFDIGPQWFGDLRYTYTDFSAAKAAGITINNDQALTVTFNRKF